MSWIFRETRTYVMSIKQAHFNLVSVYTTDFLSKLSIVSKSQQSSRSTSLGEHLSDCAAQLLELEHAQNIRL